MVKSRLGKYALSAEAERVFLNMFIQPETVHGFDNFIKDMRLQITDDLQKATNAYLMNDDPTTKALALQLKGKLELLSELSVLVKKLTK